MLKSVRLPLAAALAPVMALAAYDYPVSKTIAHVDDYHGAQVADPYRWLEDLDSADTKAWVAAQNALTDSIVDKFPERVVIRKRLTEIWNYPRTSVPFKEDNWYFYTKNDGLQNQSPLFVRDGLQGPERLLIDPNTLSADGTVAIALTSTSPDGKWLGYGLATGGSDWRELRLLDVATGKDAEDSVKWAKFTGMSWTHDAKGFFYSRYLAPAGDNPKVFTKLEHRKLYYHRVGTPQSEDRLVYEMPKQPAWFPSGTVSSDGRYLIISTSQPGTPGNSIRYVDLLDGQNPVFGGEVMQLIEQYANTYTFVGNVGRTFYFSTDKDAARGSVVAYNLDAPADAKIVLTEAADPISSIRISAGRFVVTYMHDVASRIALFDLEGRPAGEIPLPGLGVVSGVSGKFKDSELFIGYSSFLSAGTILRHDLANGKTTTHHETKINFDASKYETKQVFYSSEDGTKIPMFVIYKKGLKLDGSAPGWLYGYGGFNVTMQPQFAVPPLVWIEGGGVYAMANLRGGGEYGKDWHQAGTKERKQNVYDDFIAAADWLSAQRYTSHKKLVLDGRSNGGLLLGAVLNQRPDLAAAAVPAVGVMDMLRYHKFTVGANWASDYGNSDTPEGFNYLRAYSPLHTVRKGGKYPAILVTTGDQDDRVFPAHSYKYTAVMQQAVAPEAGPILIHIESNAGHGGSSGTTPVSKTIEDWAYRMGFGAHYAGWGK